MTGALSIAAGLGVLLIVFAAGCESTQDKSARLAGQAVPLTAQQGVTVTQANPDVHVLGTAVITDANGSAVVVRMRNSSSRPQANVPVAVNVTDAAGRTVFTNATPGLERTLTHATFLPARSDAVWVNDQVFATKPPRKATAKVGAPQGTAPKTDPVRVSGVRLTQDAVEGLAATGSVTNAGPADQLRVLLTAVARRAGRIVAAGRGVVPKVRAGKRARFQIFFIGNPKGAKVSVIAEAEPELMSTPETEIRTPALGATGEQCAHCGAGLAPDQRYCVNCGLRRAGPRVEYRELLAGRAQATAATGAPEQPPVAAGTVAAPQAGVHDTRTVSPLGAAVAVALLLLAVLLGAVIGRGGDTRTPAPVVVGAAAAGATGGFQSDWTGGDGWTVRLVALPKTSTQPAQVAAAKADAQGKGAADVGALDADTFVSLPGGSYVIYSGHYDTQAQAQAALKSVRTSFPDATVVEVSTTGGASGAAGAAGGSSTKGTSGVGSTSGTVAPKPSAAKKSTPTPSTQNYIQKSKKLPDKVGTGGTPPPADNKAPGGGSQGTTIG